MYIQSTRQSKNRQSNTVGVIMSHCTDHNTYSTLSGLTSGIPTRTTPTLTPTTLKNIEESFLDLQSIPPAPIEHHRQAGFVPPVVNLSTSVTCYSSDSNSSYASSSMAMKQEDSQWMPSCMQSGRSSNGTGNPRKTGGRRAHRDDKLTPEEEERKRVRRERNKLAAARCRKRRVDHTNTLLVETEGLEEKRATLQNEIQLLTHQKEELEFLLEAHQPTCKVKGHLKSNKNSKSSAIRPSSLALSNSNYINATSSSTRRKTPIAFPHNISVSTPSGGMFNFDSLMDSEGSFVGQVSTGLTPVSTGLTPIRSSSCADQQRYSNGDLSSPDSVNPPKLVSL